MMCGVGSCRGEVELRQGKQDKMADVPPRMNQIRRQNLERSQRMYGMLEEPRGSWAAVGAQEVKKEESEFARAMSPPSTTTGERRS
jgi:hypothetical protein